MVKEVEIWSLRVSGWGANPARAISTLAEVIAVPDTAFDGAALLISLPAEKGPALVAELTARGLFVRSIGRVEDGAGVTVE